MKENFWHQKWERGDIAFHESEVNPFLIEHFEKLNLSKDSRVFLPLCGKTHDVIPIPKSFYLNSIRL
jgi:thiopurine S-methyltransferase